MKRALPLILAIASAVVLFAVPSAGAVSIPTLTSLTHSVTQDPANGRHLTVHYEYEQTGVNPGGTWTNFFAVKAWNDDCSGGWPGTVQWETNDLRYLSPASGSGDVELTLGLNPYMPLCVGVRAMAANELMSVTYMKFGKMDYEQLESDSTPTSITLPLKVTPNGLPTSYHFSYFKDSDEGSCMDQAGSAAAQDSATETIEEDLYSEHTVYPEISGLDPETGYCIAFRIGNSMGSANDNFWWYTTGSPLPALNSESYSGMDGGIHFDVSVTPNANASDTALNFQYFKKVGADCTLVQGEESYYQYPSLSPNRGTSPATATGGITGLDSHSYYCVRAFAVNIGGGTTPGDFTTVRTVNQLPISISYSYFQPSTDDEHNIGYAIGLNDMGANDDMGEVNTTQLQQYRVAAEDCNAAGVAGETPVYSSSVNSWAGDTNFDFNLDAGTRGTENCLFVDNVSAWGAAFDHDYFLAFRSGGKPAFSNEDVTKTAHSITLTADLDPNEFETDVTFFSTPLGEGESCNADDPDTAAMSAIETDLSSVHEISKTLTGLDDFTRYCVWFLGGNDLGQAGSNWQEVRTLDATAPSKPAGLAVSDVSMTGGTLTWGDASDNDQVETYRVYKDGSLLGTTDGVLSKRIDLACGQTTHLRVSAVDPSGNESTASDEIALSATACPLPPQTETKTCFAASKSSATLKDKKKRKVKATVKSSPSADGQSLKIVATAKGAKIGFKVDGKAAKATKNSITVTGNPSVVTVSFKLAGKTKTIKLAISKLAC